MSKKSSRKLTRKLAIQTIGGPKSKLRRSIVSLFETSLSRVFVNYMMKNGKKQKNEVILFNTFKELKKETFDNPIIYLDRALNIIRPVVNVKPRRVAGVTYLVPKPIPVEKQYSMAFNNLIKASKKTDLTTEIFNSLNHRGESYDLKVQMHKIAKKNQSFIRF